MPAGGVATVWPGHGVLRDLGRPEGQDGEFICEHLQRSPADATPLDPLVENVSVQVTASHNTDDANHAVVCLSCVSAGHAVPAVDPSNIEI
jgi:hypothetical protein